MPIIVHLIDFSGRNSWIERQLLAKNQDNTKHVLVSIAKPGYLNKYLDSMGVKEFYNVAKNAFGFVKFLFLTIRFSRREEFVIYTHGHIPSIYALMIKAIAGYAYIICHHQQPNYFYQSTKKANLRRFIHSKLFILYLRKAALIQSLSSETSQRLLSLGIPSTSIRQIPLGIDFSIFSNKSVRVPRNTQPIKITSVGRLAWEKRIDLAILTVAQLIETGTPIKFDIVGDGPRRGELQDLVSHLGLVEYISFLGWKDNVAEILKNADVLLHLSLTESYGQVLMEARLCGTTICSTFVGVAIDMVSAGDSQICILRGANSKEIAIEIIDFLDTLSLRTDDEFVTPEVLYKEHNFEETLKKTAQMFHEFFNSH